MDIRYAKIRQSAFSENLPLDQELVECVREEPSHSFLMNPAGQNVYLYLTHLVKLLSEHHFGRDISQLQILDWGCGKGHVTYLLSRMGATPVSCDASGVPESSFGHETPILDQYRIQVEELNHEYELPFASGSIDVALSFGVLEHVPRDLDSLLQLHRVLRSGGLLFCFNLPYTFSWTQRLAHARGQFYHDRLYSKTRVRELLDASDFKLLDLWHRQLLPKNNVRYRRYRLFETIDQFLTEHTPLRYFATNIEWIATKE